MWNEAWGRFVPQFEARLGVEVSFIRGLKDKMS